MIRIVTIVVFVSVLTTAAAGATAGELPTVTAVLDRFVSAVGGVEALGSLEERHYRGLIVQDLSWKDPTHEEKPFLAAADVDGLVRYAEIADWPDLPAEDADLRSKLRWILHPRFALVVEEFFPELRVDRREVREGRDVVVLVPKDLKPEYYSLYFDEESGLLTHIGHHNWLQEWREVDGVLYPHKWVFGRKGGHTTYVWKEIAAGPPPPGD